MPVVHRGRRSRRPLAELKGTRRFLARKTSGFAKHVMKNQTDQTEVSICVTHRRQNTRRKLRPMVFAFWGFRPASPAWTAQEYRKRYGIETSYRQMNQGRIRTCTRDPRLRLLLVGIALILRNVWVWLHHSVLGYVRGRGIELHLEWLRLRTMLLMLQRCAEEWLGCNEIAQEPLHAGFGVRPNS
jgi:putative transposase